MLGTRSWMTLGAGGLAIAASLAMCVGSASAASESTAWQADAAHDGLVQGAGVAPPLQKAWSVDLGTQNLYTAIDGGRVFAFAYNPTNRQLSVEAIDLAAGTVDWSEPVSSMPSWYLTVDAGKVFVATSGTTSESQAILIVSAYDEQTGALDWTTTTNINPDPTPPVSSDGTLYLEAAGIGGTVLAINESDGTIERATALKWLGNPITLANGMLVMPGVCGVANGVNAATGVYEWEDYDNCDGGGTVDASYDGTNVWGEDLATNDGNEEGTIYAPATGTVEGRFDTYAPSFDQGEAVAASFSGSGVTTIEAFDAATQQPLWSFAEPSSPQTAPPSAFSGASPVGSAPLIVDGHVFAEDSSGDVFALDRGDGSVVWRGQAGSDLPSFGYDPLSSLAAGDGYLVVPTMEGLTAFRGSGNPGTDAPTSAPGEPDPQTPPAVTTSTSAPSAPSAPSGSDHTYPELPSPTTAESPSRRPVARFTHINCTRHRIARTTAGICSVSFRLGRPGTVAIQARQGRRLLAGTRVHEPSGRGHTSLRFAAPAHVTEIALTLQLTQRRRLIAHSTTRVHLEDEKRN